MRPAPSHLPVLAPVLAIVFAANAAIASEPVSLPVPAATLERAAAGEFGPTKRIALPADRVLHDVDEHGALWTSTARYKASFDADGATFVPFLGSKAPRNFPVGVALASARVGGDDIALEPASPVRVRDLVEYERGALREVYALTSGAMEQSFVFDTAPGAGDVTLAVRVEMDLDLREDAAGFTLANELGGVSISPAVAFDAAGRRIDLATTWSGDGYSIRVPASFLADARYPLVVDPSFTTFTVHATAQDSTIPDVSTDPALGTGAYVVDYAFSAADHDIYILSVDSSGTLWNAAAIDSTIEDWRHPSIAFHADTRRFLVAAEVGITPLRSIRARACTSNLGWLSPVINVSVGAGDHSWPDVGGEARVDADGRFCVVWQRYLSAVQTDVAARILDGNGVFASGMFALESGIGFVARHPSISKSAGDVTTPHGWVAVWDRSLFGVDRDIIARQISVTGVLLAPFVAASGSDDDAFPSVSSLTSNGPEIMHMIAFQRTVSATERDVLATIAVGNTPLVTYVLTAATPASQIAPAVETDGRQFFLVHMDAGTVGSTQHDLRLLQWSWNGANLVNTAVTNLGTSGADDAWPQIALDRSSGGGGSSGYVTWQVDDGGFSIDVVGARYVGQIGGPSFVFCRGDGSETACPCTNNGAPGHGCANSANSQGALLYATGQHATMSDTTRLELVGATPTTTCLFFQGTTASVPTAFGDGLRCVGGQVIRLGTLLTSLGAATFPGPTDPAVSVKGQVPVAGARRMYQAWYRNAASFCMPATFNLSNGVIIDWAR